MSSINSDNVVEVAGRKEGRPKNFRVTLRVPAIELVYTGAIDLYNGGQAFSLDAAKQELAAHIADEGLNQLIYDTAMFAWGSDLTHAVESADWVLDVEEA